MSDATRKITKLDVRHRGEQVTIKMVGTPKYRRFSARESVAARAPAVVIPVAFLLFPEYLSGLMNFATDQVWPILGLMLWISFMSLHVLLRAPARSLPVLTESEMSRH